MYKYLLILFLLFTSCVTQLDITAENIKEISVLVFESDEALSSFLAIRDKRILRGVLTTALVAARNNILNYNTTRTEIQNTPYKYQYVFVCNSLTWSLLAKESFTYWFDPIHPDAILNGEMVGYVRFPNIDRFEEDNNITRILDILFNICH